MNRHLRVTALALLAVLFLTTTASSQAAVAQQVIPPTTGTSIEITRITGVPLLDGRDDEPFWQSVPLRGGFREARPTEDGEPKQKTEFRIAHDQTYVYVFVRAYDTAPDSIIKLLSRRDDQTASDQIVVMLDSYHDKRTGYEFTVNPLGVKADYAISNDGQEDGAWNAIWDVATAIDSLGWTAEYRIPFSQLRFELSDEMTFGFMIWRDLARHTAAITFPLYRQSKPGFSSQFGDLTGIRGVARPDRLELTPYVLTQNEPAAGAGSGDRDQNFHAGADLKYAVAPNATLNATINPDFGQVEADPSVLNLSAFETFFNERRPFFVEGANIFSFPINCFAVVDCSTGEGLFYSRRIGKQPSLGGAYGDQDSPTATRILGAAKLSGRGGGGTSLGFLDAVTERVHNGTDQTLEPLTNYAVLRLNKDYDAGNGSFGAMVTGVNRDNDEWSSPYLHDAAVTGGLDARRRLGKYEFSGSLMGSYVTGSEEAIAQTQRRPAHYFQRPDDDIEFDSTLTSLHGNSFEARFAKVGGQYSRFETGYSRRSAGFETNDIGFLNRADQQTWTNWFAIRWNKPAAFYQRLNWNLNWWQYWSLAGLPTERAFNTNVHTQLNSRWWVHLGSTFGAGQVYCDRNCTRGGPALKVEPNISPWMGIQGDDRKAIVPGLWMNYTTADGGRSHFINLSPEVEVKVASRLSTTISADLSKNDDDSQWFGNFVDGSSVTHYTFADLQQETVALTWRLNYTFTPNASFQLYASPFISKGTYTRIRELNDPRADNYDDRFQAYGDTAVTNNPGGFNVQEFRSNMVFRWEYRPGSTLFLVWSQGRGEFQPTEGNETFGGNFKNLFDSPAEDRFLVKVSYWFSK